VWVGGRYWTIDPERDTMVISMLGYVYMGVYDMGVGIIWYWKNNWDKIENYCSLENISNSRCDDYP
jgi:hypothetical protein